MNESTFKPMSESLRAKGWTQDANGNLTAPRKRTMPVISNAEQPFAVEISKAPIKRASTDVQKLNKTETARFNLLTALGVRRLRVQVITLKIAHDCRLTVDFTYLDSEGRFVFEDTKGGFWREDAKIKIKVAARMFPEFRFIVAHKNDDGWVEEDIKP